MLPGLTVHETIKFAADLRMSRDATETERVDACDAILSELGLSHVRDVLVGGAMRRGVSGGERKRLAVGVELGFDVVLHLHHFGRDEDELRVVPYERTSGWS